MKHDAKDKRSHQPHLYTLDEHGAPVPCEDVLAWARWFEASDAQRAVAVTTIADTLRVSTCFLGIDQDPCGSGPVLWETMIFGGTSDALTGVAQRYRSREDARAGHERWVAHLRGELVIDA